HCFVYLKAELHLELVEGRFYFIVLTAPLIDIVNAFLEIDARLDRTQDLVTGAEDSFEEMKLLRQQLIDAFIRCVLPIKEIDYDNVMLLSVTMKTADALFDSLRIPRQVVVHDQRTKLKVDSFRSSFRRDHNEAFVPEIVDERRAHISCARASDTVSALVFV